LTGAERSTARGVPLEPGDAPFVATVGGRPITVSHVEARLAEARRGPRGRHMPPDGVAASPTLRRWIVRELVTEEVLHLEAQSAGIEDDPSRTPSRGAIARLVDRVTGAVTVPESEIRAYYERNSDLYRRPEFRRVRHVLVSDAAAAHEVLRRLESGEAIEDVVREVSTRPGSWRNGGDLGNVRRGELAGPLEDALFAADIGAIVGPYETEHGWYVARVEACVPAAIVPYREVRKDIEAELLGAARGRAFEEWLEARRRALAIVEPEFAHPADPAHGVPSHRH
jgi:[acyl-carrier-protein] S-malonyltransferase